MHNGQCRRLIPTAAILACFGIIITASAKEPLRAVLHLRVGDPNDASRRNVRLDQPGVLPLKTGDRFWIEARLNRPAYLYLVWVGADGKVAPIFPWQPGHWKTRPTNEQKLDLAHDTSSSSNR